MERKKVYKFFTLFEYEEEQKFLQEMHSSGWALNKISGLGTYHFIRCNPENVAYQLDYNREGRAHKEEYIRMFTDCGWEYLQDFVGYSYFRKAVTDDGETEEIFCDDESRLQMVNRIFYSRMIPVLVLFFCLLVPQFYLQMFVYHNYWIAGPYGFLFLLVITVFVQYVRKLRKFRSNMKGS